MVEMEAHVVNIRNAAAADDEGLLKPLLQRWQDEACSQTVFGLPAVRAVINFKWDRSASIHHMIIQMHLDLGIPEHSKCDVMM